MTPVSNLPQEIRPNTLDAQLIQGAVGRYERVPHLLRLSYQIFQIPLVRNAPAIRDDGLYRRFANRPATNLDLYDIDPAGDTVSWLYNVREYEHARKLLIDRRSEVLKFDASTPANEAEARKLLAVYLTNRSLAALDEVRQQTQRDGATIKVIAFDMAAGLQMRDKEYLDASRQFFDAVSRRLGAPVVDVREAFAAQPHMISDAIHLNSLGAGEFSRLLAARLAGGPDPAREAVAVPALIAERQPDAKWTPFTPLILKRAGEPTTTLRLAFLQNWGVRFLGPYSNVELALRRADGAETIVPARVLAPGEVVADTSRVAFGTGSEVMIAQLLYRNGTLSDKVDLPLASFVWSAARPNVDFNALPTLAKVRSVEPLYSALSPVKVAWEDIDSPSHADFIAIYPAGVPGAVRIASVQTKGKSSGTLEMTPLFSPGEFELRLFRNDGPEMIAISEPFRVAALTGKIELAAAQVESGQVLRVSWSALSYPHKDDWVGLFEKGAKTDVLLMKHTGGARQGNTEIALPKALKPGDYELRLYSSGRWDLMDTIPVLITPPAADVPGR